MTAAPPGLEATRLGLHRLAEEVLSPVQADVNGDIHFVWTPGGFGTPRFGGDRQLRVDGATLVVAGGGACRRRPLGSLRAAASFVGWSTAGVEDVQLEVDAAAALWLGAFFGFTQGVLDELASDAVDAAPVRLWPEHFDMATDLGDDAAGARATYGGSPGDAHHREPYLYVAPWKAPPPSPEQWNATGFAGAELSLTALLAAPDQRAAARAFFGRCRTALHERTHSNV